MNTHSFSLYLHIPFCHVRCAYCDFNTYAGLDALMPAYVAALVKEIRQVGAAGNHPVAHTVFFGGGTPSLLPLELHADILAALRDSFQLTPDCEMTLEANPGTVSRAYLAGLRELGFNRLSLGVQSSHPHELKLLDRMHLFGDVVQAVTWARAAGFDNLNLDLIFALPQQTLTQWQATLNRVLALGPDHLSAYALSLEHGTPMRAWVHRGLLPLPDPDLAAEMYEWASAMLEKYGYQQYEISNWAKKVVGSEQSTVNSEPLTVDCSLFTAFACRHNLQYWRTLPYLGFGAGAHGYAAGHRYATVLAPTQYIASLKDGAALAFPFSSAVREKIVVTRTDEMNEMMLMGLRLVQAGVTDEEFRARFGVGLEAQYGEILSALARRNLLVWDGTRAHLTAEGRLLGNIVFREFV